MRPAARSCRRSLLRSARAGGLGLQGRLGWIGGGVDCDTGRRPSARVQQAVRGMRQTAGVPRPSAAIDTAALRKARGAFFTPEPLARYITDWAVRSTSDRVLEPSCGEAAFLLAAV